MRSVCFGLNAGSGRALAFIALACAALQHRTRAEELTAPGRSPPRPLPRELGHALASIRGKDIIAHAKVISDPKFRGRRSGGTGALEAAHFIVRQFRRCGLSPGGDAGGYFQLFPLGPSFQVASSLEIRTDVGEIGPLQRGEHYMPVHVPGGTVEVESEIAFAGFGISSEPLDFDEYRDLDVSGAAVLVFGGVPWEPGTGDRLGPAEDDASLGSIEYKAQNAASRGARAMLYAVNATGWRVESGITERLRLPDPDAGFESPIPVVQITDGVAARILGVGPEEMRLWASDIARGRAPKSRRLTGTHQRFSASISGRPRMGRNIIGVLPGRDEACAREAVVLGAHYDHIGEALDDLIYFGANDNAAGVAAVLAVARAYAKLPGHPRRTVVFVCFDAEEIGRLGSQAYVCAPPIPIARTAFMVNFDMIGCNEPDHIYPVGTRSSDEIHRIHQEMNRYVGLRLTHPESYRLGRSDHTPFYCARVPIMYLFGGLHPEYNTPRDTWEILIPEKVEKVTQLAFLTSYRVAEDEGRPSFSESDQNPLPPAILDRGLVP